MTHNKDRLYVALHARSAKPKRPGLEDTYHWSLVVGPKNDKGKAAMRYHVKGGQPLGFTFERQSIPFTPAQMMLARICIGKIVKGSRVDSILQNVPVRDHIEGWSCVSWVQDALESLAKDEEAMGTSVLDWETVSTSAMRYVQSKKDQHRYDSKGNFDIHKIATYDLLTEVELIP